MHTLVNVIQQAQEHFNQTLISHGIDRNGLSQEEYQRFLSLKFHLTKDVQRHIFAVASHCDMAHRRCLRDFLCKFANEEELHYLLAKRDLDNMGLVPLTIPFDVKLWKCYFDRQVAERPFVRLGATAVLENIAATSGDVVRAALQKSNFANPKTTSFIITHLHEDMPHGDQILAIIEGSNLSEKHWHDLIEGAQECSVFYMRFLQWIFHGQASNTWNTAANRQARDPHTPPSVQVV